MRRFLSIVAAASALSGIAFAQEPAGAGRVDITIAPAGGMFFTSSSSGAEPKFDNYTIAGATTFNVSPWVAVEGEFGNSVGIRQHLVAPNGAVLANQSSPRSYQYNGNVIVHPGGSDHALAPYVVGGLGGITLLGSEKVRPLGITSNTTFLTGNIGAGMKVFAGRRWGVRADYRLFAIRNKDSAPQFFGREEVRYAHRLYGALLLNY
jgi:hypothetical protein